MWWKTQCSLSVASIQTGPIPWTSTWRWWSTVMGWWQLQEPHRCLATLAGSTWRNMVRVCQVEDSLTLLKTTVKLNTNPTDNYLNIVILGYSSHCVEYYIIYNSCYFPTVNLLQELNRNTLPKLPGKTTSIPPTTRKTQLTVNNYILERVYIRLNPSYCVNMCVYLHVVIPSSRTSTVWSRWWTPGRCLTSWLFCSAGNKLTHLRLVSPFNR